MKNLATGEITNGDWVATNDDTTFDEVKSPEIDGYVVDKKVVEEVKDVEADDKDLEETVTYRSLLQHLQMRSQAIQPHHHQKKRLLQLILQPHRVNQKTKRQPLYQRVQVEERPIRRPSLQKHLLHQRLFQVPVKKFVII